MRLWSLLSRPFRRVPHQPLAHRRPQRREETQVPLGMEAMDLSAVRDVNRRNGSLERVSTFFKPDQRFGSFLETAETTIVPLADDETYAARYHRAYNRKKGLKP